METSTYVPDQDQMFDAFRRYEDIFNVDCKDRPGAKIAEHSRFLDYIPPKKIGVRGNR